MVMRMRSKKYWADRATALEYWLQQEAGKSVREINDLYYRAIIDIEEEIEKIRKELLTMGDLTEDEWNELLRKADRDVSYNRLKELLEKTDDPDTMGDILNRMNAQAYGARITRLDELSNKVVEAVLDATAAERAIAEKCLSRVLREAFYTNIDNIAEGYNVGINFGIMPSRAVAAALQTPWNNMTYSERIWKNGREFASKVEQTVTTGLLKGASVQKMAAELKDCTEKGNYVRERLVRTETAHFMAVGQLEAYKEAGIEKYRFLASLSERTCDVCADLDGKTFNVDEATEGVNCNPIHPNCRCVTITAEASLSDRLAKDPLTDENYHTGKDMTFKEWKESFTPEQKQAFEVNVRKYRNMSSDKKQYERYIKRLGAENLPETFDKFQMLKYTDIEKWTEQKLAYRDRGLQEKIRNEFKLAIHEGKQGKHILGHNNYIEGRSYITISIEEAQQLVLKYAGTGKIDRDKNGLWKNTESVISDKYIGYSLNEISGEKYATKAFKIHYSKKGVHIVPKKEG